MVTPAQQELARWILRHEGEVDAHQEPDAPIALTERVLRKLAPGVTVLVTTAGYRALLARALHLAQAQFPVLDAVRIPAAGGYIEGPRVPGGRPSDDSLVALIGNLIALLATFIGDRLTGNLIRDAWSDAPLQRTTRRSGGTT